MGLSYYPENPSHNEAAVLLDMMSAEQITKIVRLVNARGLGIVNEIKGRERFTGSGLSPLAILDSKYVPYDSQESVALGMNTVLLAQLRKPQVSNDHYELILKDAFSLSPEMANAAAKKIETEDILGGTYKDPSGKDLPWYSTFAAKIKDAARKTANSLPMMSLMSWEIDQTQEYDLDLLYEWKLLGDVVRDLNERTKLMGAQASINSSMALFRLGTGDVEDGDPSVADAMVGDAVRTLSARNMPRTVFGGMDNLRRLGRRHQHQLAVGMSSATGATPSSMGDPSSPGLTGAFSRLMAGSPTKLGILGALLGASPMILSMIKDAASKGTGDVDYGDIHESIASDYGDVAADAWLHGDVEGFTQEIHNLANSTTSTGDVSLDGDIDRMITETSMGDVERLEPEVGGLFLRARRNAAKRRMRRRQKRARLRAERQRFNSVSGDEGIDDSEQEPTYAPAPRRSSRQSFQSDDQPSYADRDDEGVDMWEGTDN
jgi:hypothetical protein